MADTQTRTGTAVTRDMLVSELQNLLRLTAFEQTIAAVRRSQAATTSIADELRANYSKSVERSQLLQDAVRQAGGVPDVVGSALSKAGAFVQTQVNQVQTLQGALLGDLALEHQLRERTRYARTLAESLGYYQLIPVFERLDVAHTATIEWLEARLTEVGRTGTSAIQATPVQALVGATRKVALLPFGVFAATVNRSTSLLRKGASTATETVTSAAARRRDGARGRPDGGPHGRRGCRDRCRHGDQERSDAAGAARTAPSRRGHVAEGAQSAAQTVSDTATSAAEAVGSGAQTAAQATAQAAESTARPSRALPGRPSRPPRPRSSRSSTSPTSTRSKPPFAGYASLSGDSVMRHVRDTEDVEHLREILAFEQAHKNRKGVVGALERAPHRAGRRLGLTPLTSHVATPRAQARGVARCPRHGREPRAARR